MNSMRHYLDRRTTKSNRPLAVALLLSTAITAMILSVVSLPRWEIPPDATPFVVELNIRGQEEPVQPDIEIVSDQVAYDDPASTTTDVPPVDNAPDDASTLSAESAPEITIEWYAVLDAVVEGLSAAADTPPSMSPKLDELRRIAKVRYAPVVDRGPRPIWENVEKDQMGRTVLRAGDCYRVLEDPRVTNRWAQENFGQYFVYCETQKAAPKNLPFVAQIVERHDYLQERVSQ